MDNNKVTLVHERTQALFAEITRLGTIRTKMGIYETDGVPTSNSPFSEEKAPTFKEVWTNLPNSIRQASALIREEKALITETILGSSPPLKDAPLKETSHLKGTTIDDVDDALFSLHSSIDELTSFIRGVFFGEGVEERKSDADVKPQQSFAFVWDNLPVSLERARVKLESLCTDIENLVYERNPEPNTNPSPASEYNKSMVKVGSKNCQYQEKSRY